MKMHKAEVAMRQIDTAIALFLEARDYLSVVTLAGAGEELIGNLLKRDGEKNIASHLVELDKKSLNGGRKFVVVNQEINGFRNSLKHANMPDEDFIDVAESQEHAIAMLSRALANYTSYKAEMSVKMWEFLEWLLKNRPELFPAD